MQEEIQTMPTLLVLGAGGPFQQKKDKNGRNFRRRMSLTSTIRNKHNHISIFTFRVADVIGCGR